MVRHSKKWAWRRQREPWQLHTWSCCWFEYHPKDGNRMSGDFRRTEGCWWTNMSVCTPAATKEDVGYLSLPFSALLPWDRLSKRYLPFSWVCWPVNYWEKSISAPSARIIGTHSHAWLWCGPWFGDLRACPILQEKAFLPTDPSPQALKLFSYTIKTVKCYTFSSTLLLIQQIRMARFHLQWNPPIV